MHPQVCGCTPGSVGTHPVLQYMGYAVHGLLSEVEHSVSADTSVLLLFYQQLPVPLAVSYLSWYPGSTRAKTIRQSGQSGPMGLRVTGAVGNCNTISVLALVPES